MKLGNKIALIYFVLGFLSLLAFNLIWFLPSLSETKKNAAKVQLEVAKRGAIEIESFLEYKLASLEKLGYFLGPEETMKEKGTALNKFLQKEQAFFEIVLIDQNGQEQIKLSQSNIFAEKDLLNQSSQDYFEKASQGNFFVSQTLFSENGEPFSILAVPIYSVQEKISGVLTAKLKVKEVWQVISSLNIGSTSHAFVVDKRGRLIADSDPSRVSKNLILINLEPVRKVVEESRVITGDDPSDRYLNEQNQMVLAVGIPLEKLNWGLIIERQESEAYGAIGNKIIVFFLIIILGGVSIIFITRALSKYLFRSLKKLKEGVKIIGSGDLDVRLKIKTGDEIEELADAFNDMACQLKESYLYMERKVEERTRELKIQRDRLDETAKKLIQQEIALRKIKEQQEKALNETTAAKQKAETAKVATLNILEDIDEARQAQEAEKNKVEAVLGSLTDGLIMIEGLGRISLINKKAETMLELEEENIINKRIEEIEVPVIKKISQIIKSHRGQIEKEEIILGGEGKQEQVLEISTIPVSGYDKKILGQLIILHDITREKIIERTKSEFVTIAAHQLRTPLSAVKWTLRLILDQDAGPISDEQEEILKKGYQSNERMIDLVNDLLNVARIEEGRFLYDFSRVSFVDLLKETLESFQTSMKMKNITVKLRLPKGNKIEVMMDREKMKLALQNLIENAINYSPAKSDVTISLKCDKMNLSLAIADRGMGIPKNQQSRVFAKFFRGNNAVKMETEGTGLGLFLVKNIIEKHGGKIWFETEENKGSTFYFTLPIK